jgi:hypothetical protein
MPYVIEGAYVIRQEQLQRCSLVIDRNRIDYISEQAERYTWMRMEIGEMIVTPGHVMLDFSFQQPRTFLQFKQYVQQQLIAQGCTTLLAICDVFFESQLVPALQRLRQHLLNSPIDYFIGVKVPLRKLTPSLMIACRRWKIPVIFVEMQENDVLHSVPWHWIAEVLKTYPLTFVPYWPNGKRMKKQEAIWRKLLAAHHIPFIPFPLQERTPLSLDVLKKIGIYPQKGDLRIGGEVDYNLYKKESVSRLVAETPIVDYDNHVPVITVHKGRLLKAGNQIYFYPGFGMERVIRAPGMFVAHLQ